MTDPTRTPPLPGGNDDSARRRQAQLRLRLLKGEWLEDLIQHMREHFSAARQQAMGKPDLSTNLWQSIIGQLSVLYDRPAVIRHEDPEAAERATQLLADAGWWSLAGELQRFTLACRECFVRPTLAQDGGVLLRIVTPDCVYAEGAPESPDLPAKLVEARLRDLGDGEEWFWDAFDVSDPAAPTYRVLRAKDEEDVTEQVLGSTDWPAEFRDEDGRPLLPYATYHAKRTGRLWDWRAQAEAVDGSLTIAVLWTWWVHCVRDSAWAQKWTMDAVLRGTQRTGSGSGQASTIDTDPSSVMQFRADGDRASIGQWTPPVDPLTLGTSISEFEQRLLVHFGLTPGDAQRTGGGPSSGYAISLRREPVRQAQRRFAPNFARGDQQLLRIVSGLVRGTDMQIPADGYSITYPGPPKSWEETQAELDRLAALGAVGLASKVDAYLELYPGTTREQAAEALALIEQEGRQFGALAAPTQPGATGR